MSMPINQTQRSILNKLIAYLEKKISRPHPPEYTRFISQFKSGYCAGISSLWLYSRWLQNQPKGLLERDDHDWFKGVIDTIVRWDEKVPVPLNIAKEFDRFISLIEFYQHPNHALLPANPGDLDVLLEDNVKESEGVSPPYRKPKKEYSIASLLNFDQLKKILKEGIIHPYRLIYISSSNHATALFFDGKNYYFFNPNSSDGEKVIPPGPSAIDELAESIFIANGFPTPPLFFSSPLSFSMFSMGQVTPAKYPPQSEVLDHIEPSIKLESFFTFDVPGYATGLHQAAKIGCLESTKYFLNKKVNVDEVMRYDKEVNFNAIVFGDETNREYTAFTIAIIRRHFDVALQLLNAGADPTAGYNEGTVAALLKEGGNPDPALQEIKKIFLQHGVNLGNQSEREEILDMKIGKPSSSSSSPSSSPSPSLSPSPPRPEIEPLPSPSPSVMRRM